MFLLSVLFIAFGVVAVEYFKGMLYRCVDMAGDIFPPDVVPNRTICEARDDAVWQNPPYNFDDIFQAMKTLFYLAIGGGWLEIMEVVDATGIDLQPQTNTRPLGCILYPVSRVFASFAQSIYRRSKLSFCHSVGHEPCY